MVLALAVTPEGFPLVRPLPWKHLEGHTLVPVLRRCMETFSPRQTVVADRAMFTEENLEGGGAGCSFVVGAKLRSLGRAMRDKILTPETTPPARRSRKVSGGRGERT